MSVFLVIVDTKFLLLPISGGYLYGKLCVIFWSRLCKQNSRHKPFELESWARAELASRTREVKDRLAGFISVRGMQAIQLHASWAAGRGCDSQMNHGMLCVGGLGGGGRTHIPAWRGGANAKESLAGSYGSSLADERSNGAAAN
jgi:hypothetical protein